MLAPVDKAKSATVYSSIFQAGNNVDLTSSLIDYTFKNDDIGATYNSATLDLASVLNPVVDSIVANNPNFNSNFEVYEGMKFNISNAGNVSSGWTSSIDPNTSILTINPAGPFGYTPWTSDANQNTLTGTLNLFNMLDYNGNGIIDPNETLAFMGIANNAFNAKFGTTGNIYADANQIGVIPEPSSALLLGAGLGALALRRRREPKTDLYKKNPFSLDV